MNRKITIVFALFVFLSLPCFVQGAHLHFLEEISGIDYLTNNLNGNTEYFVAEYSYASKHDDKRNGVVINQISTNDMV